MILHLLMAILWLALGVGMIVWQWMHPEVPGMRILDTELSSGWLGMLLAGYNFARWWTVRVRSRNRETPRQDET